MEEKKSKKISVSTVLIILFIIAIVIMGYFIYKLNNDKKLSDNKVSDLNNQLSGLENTVNNLQNTMSNTSNTTAESDDTTKDNTNEKTSNDNTQTSTNEKNTFSDSEVKETVQNYLSLVGVCAGSPKELLAKLGYTESEIGNGNPDSEYYVKTNIKYSDYKTKMLGYMTEQCFEKEFANSFKNVDGYLYCFSGGATGLEYVVKNVTAKGSSSDLIYTVNVDYIHPDETSEQMNFEFGIENYNGKCVVSYCK